jgi:DNA invertase Pin-like site-specific DNA recombinase
MKRTANPLVAVGYIRVSTDEQHLGPAAQRSQIEAWAQREGITVAAWHTDAGVSGAAEIDARPGLVGALADVARLRAGVLAVAKRDRLARDVVVAATVERTVGRSGARVQTADGIANGSTADDAFRRHLEDGLAALERARVGTRTKAALAVLRALGEVSNHAPFGYRAEGGRLVADEAEQEVLAAVREARARGLTVRAIALELEQAGIVSRRGKPLHFTAVADMVRAHA